MEQAWHPCAACSRKAGSQGGAAGRDEQAMQAAMPNERRSPLDGRLCASSSCLLPDLAC